MIPASQLSRQPTAWLWKDRIPLGAITVIEGRPGANKSTLIYDLVARVSTDRAMPHDGHPRAVGSRVLLFQGEDPEGEVTWRLETAKADLDRVFVYGADGKIRIPENVDFVRGEVERRGARLVVFDPVSTYTNANLNSETAVRAVVTPLAEMAAATGAAVVLVRHLNKSGTRDPLYAGAGSIAVVAACRSCLVVGVHPVDPEQRVVAVSKSNFAGAVPSLRFMVIAAAGSAPPKAVWQGPVDVSATDLLGSGLPAQDSARGEAIEFLLHELGNGPVVVADVRKLARAAGIAERTLRRAKEDLKVKSVRSGFGAEGIFRWELPPRSEAVRAKRTVDQRQFLNTLIRPKKRRIESIDE